MSDPIDREALMRKFTTFIKAHGDSEPAPTWNDAVSLVGSMPSAQPDYDLSGYSDRLWQAAYERGKAEAEVKHGKWKLNKDGNWACPFCEFDPYHDNMNGMNYCPKCGAKLDGKGEEDGT